MSNIIVGYESAQEYINNNLPEQFPYKLEVSFGTFLGYYNSYGYYSKRYENQYYQSGELLDSKEGRIFLKSELDSYIKDALKPIEIKNPKGYSIKKEDITIDYICSCVLIKDAAKNNTLGYTAKSFSAKLMRDFPIIKVGLPLKGTASTYLIHKTYLKTYSNEVDNIDTISSNNIYEITNPDDIIVGYELAKDYINNNLPKGFPYKMDMSISGFLSNYQSYGYYSKSYQNNCRVGSNKLVDSSRGRIFFKSELDSYIKDALKVVQIRNPKGYSIKKEDITIDYICSCVLVKDIAKNNTDGYEISSFVNKLIRYFPVINLGLPLRGSESNTLIHKSYLTNNRKVIDLDDFKNHIIKMLNHPIANNIKNLTAVEIVKKLRDNIGELEDLYELKGRYNSYVFYGDRFDKFKNKFLDSITIHNPENPLIEDDILNKSDISLDNLDMFIVSEDLESLLNKFNLNNHKLIKFKQNIPYIKIPFFSLNARFYKKSSVLKLKSILSNDKSYEKLNDESEYHSADYWIEKIPDYLPSFMYEKKVSKQALYRTFNKYEIKRTNLKSISQNEFNELIKTYYNNIEILNSDDDNLKQYNLYDLNKKSLDEYINGSYLDNMANLSKGTGTKILRKLNCPCVVWNTRYFYRKNLLEKIAEYRNNRIPILYVAKELTDKYFPISRYRVADIAKDNGIKIFEEGCNGIKSTRYILKDDVHIIEAQIIEEYEDTIAPFTSIANYMFSYIDRNPILNSHRVKGTMSYFKKHIIKVNNNVRVVEASKRKKSPFKYIYKIISTLDKEIYEYTQDEINELLDNIEDSQTQETLNDFISFYNYIMKERKEHSRIILIERREKIPAKAYPLKNYFCLLGNILELLNDKKFVINKLYGNMNLSTSLLYVMSHYITCWRNLTIVSELPNANLSLIGFDDEIKFLDWYKQPNSKFTEKMGELICTDIENKVIRVRKAASKNNGRLLIYISKFLYQYYGLLACICEANRCLHNKNTKEKKMKDSIFSSINFSSTVASSYLNTFIPHLLSDFDGKFSNRNANKSFETYISDKSEEWNLGMGYLMSAVARGHKIDAHVLGETTKIYIEKNIDNLSFEVFSNKILSGIKYKFMDVIYDDFDKKSVEEKSLLTMNNEITNLQIESMLKSVAVKKEAIDKFFNKYLTSKSKKRETLFEVMYGSDCNAKHNNTKCLLRAYNSTNLNKFVYSDTSSSNGCIYPPTKKDCIGCPLLIAERYFLFELNNRLKDTLKDLNNCNSKMDKMIHLSRIKDLYFPIISEAISELGQELVNEVLDVRNMIQIYESNKKLIGI